MKNRITQTEKFAQRLSKEQLIKKLKQKNLKGGHHGCPPPDGNG